MDDCRGSQKADEAAANQILALRERLGEAKKAIGRQDRMSRTAYFISSTILAATCIASVFVYLYSDTIEALSARTYALMIAFGFLYSLTFATAAFMRSDRRLAQSVQDLEDEIDLRQMNSASLEQKAHKLLKIQQRQLSRYLEVILQQSRRIFAIGIGALLIGVGIVIFTIWQTRNMGSDVDLWQKAMVAIVGAVGAILTNYVAAIYLKMFSDIGSAVQNSISSLNQSTNLNFANVLIANISSDETRNETLKAVAVAISKPAQA